MGVKKHGENRRDSGVWRGMVSGTDRQWRMVVVVVISGEAWQTTGGGGLLPGCYLHHDACLHSLLFISINMPHIALCLCTRLCSMPRTRLPIPLQPPLPHKHYLASLHTTYLPTCLPSLPLLPLTLISHSSFPFKPVPSSCLPAFLHAPATTLTALACHHPPTATTP